MTDNTTIYGTGSYIDEDRITRYWVFVPITYAQALEWIAEEAGGKPERIWLRLFDTCKAIIPWLHARDWEMDAEAVEGGVKVEFWKKYD
jgi:hypothetical protein